jgi:hypothetical protein
MIETFKVEHQFSAAWDLINCIGNRKTRKKCNISGDTPEDRLRKWHAHFSLLFSNPEPTHSPNTDAKLTLDPIFSETELRRLASEFKTSPFTDIEVQSAINSLQNGKSAGVDGITAEVLKVPALRDIVTIQTS